MIKLDFLLPHLLLERGHPKQIVITTVLRDQLVHMNYFI